MGTLARQAIPYTSCLTRVLTGPSMPVLGWGLRGQPPTPHAVPPVHCLHLSVAGPAESSWFFRPRVGVAFLPLPIQLAPGRDPRSPSRLVAIMPLCAPCVAAGGRGQEVPGSRTCSASPCARGRSSPAVPLQPTVASVGPGLAGGPCWGAGSAGCDRTESVRAGEDSSPGATQGAVRWGWWEVASDPPAERCRWSRSGTRGAPGGERLVQAGGRVQGVGGHWQPVRTSLRLPL